MINDLYSPVLSWNVVPSVSTREQRCQLFVKDKASAIWTVHNASCCLSLEKNDNQTLNLSHLHRHFSPGSVFVCLQLSLGHPEMFWISSSMAALWGPTLCTATATCSGYLTGWRAATRSRASPVVPGLATWLTSYFSLRRPRSLPAQVVIHIFNTSR